MGKKLAIRPVIILPPQMAHVINCMVVVSPGILSCSEERGPGGGEGKAFHPSLPAFHVTVHIVLLWQCWDCGPGCYTAAMPPSVVSGLLLDALAVGPHSFVSS